MTEDRRPLDANAHLSCAQLVTLVTEYLEGTLEDASLFEEHIVFCNGCAVYVRQLRAAIASAGELRDDDVAQDAIAQMRRAFRDWSRR